MVILGFETEDVKFSPSAYVPDLTKRFQVSITDDGLGFRAIVSNVGFCFGFKHPSSHKSLNVLQSRVFSDSVSVLRF